MTVRRKFRPTSVGPSYELRFDAESKRFACCGKSIVIWDLASRTRLAKLHPFKHPGYIEWSPSTDRLAVKSTSGKLVITTVDDGASEPMWLRRRGVEGAEIAFSACGNFLVDCDWDGKLQVLDVRTSEAVYSESIPNVMITSLAYNHARTLFAYVVCPKPGLDYIAVRKWPFQESQPVLLHIGWQNVECIAFSPDETRLAVAVSGVGLKDARVQVYALCNGDLVAERGYSLYASGKSIAWCPHYDVIANVEQGGVRIYDSSLTRLIAFLPAEYPCHVAFSSCGKHVGVGDWGKGFVLPVEEALTIVGGDA